MSRCPVCHHSDDGVSVECPACHVPMVAESLPYEQFAVPGAPSGAGAPGAAGGAPLHSPSPFLPPPGQHGTHYPVGPPTEPPLGFTPMQFGAPTPPVPTPVSAVPVWDRAGTKPVSSPGTSTAPALVVVAVVMGVLLVGAVGWFTFGRGSGSEAALDRTVTTLTGVDAPIQPVAGQTQPIGDGWVTYRSVDGSWLFDSPVVPSAPIPLPSNPSIQMAYGLTPTGRIGFGWAAGQLAPGTDEQAVLVEIMNGIATSRGARGLEPVVLPAPTGPIVTATMQLTSGSALFILRSVDGHPLVAMVVADLGDPDPAVANRMLESFRPAG